MGLHESIVMTLKLVEKPPKVSNGDKNDLKVISKTQLKILIVDDNDEIVWLIKQFLKDSFQLYTAQDGRKAVKLYKSIQPDLVLMDIVMPVLDGIKATQIIRDMDPQAKIIGITAFTSQKGYEMKQAGAIKVLSKPTELTQILKEIDMYVVL